MGVREREEGREGEGVKTEEGEKHGPQGDITEQVTEFVCPPV